MAYFVVITEETSAKGLVQLFKDNVQKLYSLLKSIILNRELQFTAKLTKKINKMLEIEIKLSIAFHPQIDDQTKKMNQELK